MKRLKNKVALITQAGSNFGRVLAEAFAKEGADLFLQDWKERKAVVEKNAEEIAKQTGSTVVAGVYDLTSGDGAHRMTRHAMRQFSKIDILVNTAMHGGHGIIFDIPEEEWDLTIDRGLKSYFLTMQYVGEEMARVGYGKVINITSIVGRIGSGGALPWGACRGGVDALTYAAAQALGEYGVRVVGLARGATDSTPYPEEALKERLLRIPFGRLATEDDIIGPAIFLATEESDWVNGSIIYADGGYSHAAATDREHRATEFPLKRRGLRRSKKPRKPDFLDTQVS